MTYIHGILMVVYIWNNHYIQNINITNACYVRDIRFNKAFPNRIPINKIQCNNCIQNKIIFKIIQFNLDSLMKLDRYI